MPFDDDDDDGSSPKKRVGVKLDNKNSVLGEVPKKPSKEDFTKKAMETNEQLNEYTTRGAELSLQFKKLLEDKTLVQNKTIFAVDAERELLSKLVQLGIDMNLDENEKEGMGSMGLIMLLFRALLIQRDKINNLDYTIHLLEKKIKELAAPPVDSKK